MFAVQSFPVLANSNTELSPVEIPIIRTNNSLIIQAATKRHLVAQCSLFLLLFKPDLLSSCQLSEMRFWISAQRREGKAAFFP